jgi:hypothetical protein
MKMNFHDIAKKAHGGDNEAMTLLIIEAPNGMQGERSPEEFAEQLSLDEGACGKMEEMDYTSKNSFDAYAEEHGGPEEESGVQNELGELLSGWTERDPETDAGKYYYDLKNFLENYFGSPFGESEEGDEE